MNKIKAQFEEYKEKYKDIQQENERNVEKLKSYDEKNSGAKLTIQKLRRTLKDKDVEIIKQRGSIQGMINIPEEQQKTEELTKKMKSLRNEIEYLN